MADSPQEAAPLATVHIRCTNGSKFSVQADLSITVAAFKPLLAPGSGVSADQQRLIYKGRVLKDDSTLESYGVQNDHTVHLVRAAPAASAAANSAPPVINTPADNLGGGLGGSNGLGGLGGLTGIGAASDLFGAGFGAGNQGFPEIQQVQQQLMQNPDLIRDMMNMPAVQSLINNPELMRNLIMNNPHMRSLMDRNPELGHILNDPSTLRQTLDAARNPELMREMMRNTDRAMSNIEATPEGFNMLRRMYETVEAPFLNAATGADGTNDSTTNPFAALLGTPGTQPQVGVPVPTTPAAEGAETVAPNTAPLPNPWNPTQTGTTGQGATGTRTATGGGTPGLGGLGFPDLGANLFDPALFQQTLQNPALLQMMQTLFSNPQYLNQLIEMQPALRSMVSANPALRDMMQNPEFMRQAMNPQMIQHFLSILRGQQQTGQQIPGALTGGGTNGAATGSPFDMGSLLGLFGGLGGGIVPPSTVPEVNTVAPEQLYATQLSQLQEMGFIDTEANIQALRSTGGNVHAAVERLLGNLG